MDCPNYPEECAFGAAVILKNTQKLKAEIEGARLSKDIEYVHRLRVASRRIRSAIPIFKGCYTKHQASSWDKQITKVTHSLGETRNADIQIQLLENIISQVDNLKFRPGMRRLLMRLSQNRQNLQERVNHTIDHLLKNGVLEEIEQSFSPISFLNPDLVAQPAAIYQLSFATIKTGLKRFITYEPFLYQPQNYIKHHEMRIAAKQLRYSMEFFASLYRDNLGESLKAVRESQENLGLMHDCDVWMDFLPQFLEEEKRRVLDFSGNLRYFNRLVPGIEFFQQNRKNERERIYHQFLIRWETWKSQDVWETLSQTIKRPVQMVKNPYSHQYSKNLS